MTLPKRCRVIVWERRQSNSRRSPADGESSRAKSARLRGCVEIVSWTAAPPASLASFIRAANGSELNSRTKLTAANLVCQFAVGHRRLPISHYLLSIGYRLFAGGD